MATTRGGQDYIPALTYERLTPLFDPITRLFTRERHFKERLLDQAALAPGQRVLDLGCGTGTLAVWAKQREPGIELVGLDGDPEVLRRARRKAEAAGVELRLDEGMSFDLPYPDASFDRVLSSLFFHHLKPDAKRTTLAQVARVLRPGGELHVADFGPPSGPLMRVNVRLLARFDGVENVRDNVEGNLPAMFEAAGLAGARERSPRVRTLFGSLSYYSASRP